MWVRCCLTWGDRNWGTWARRLGWDELRGCTGGCCGCCMVLACAAPLLPNIPRLPLGICSRTVTQALNGTPQHITRVFLVCAGIILSDYDRHESRVYWKPGLESGRAKAAMYPTSQTPQTLYSCLNKRQLKLKMAFVRMQNPGGSQDEQSKVLGKSVHICIAGDRRMETLNSQ